MHRYIGANIIEKGGKVSRQGCHMFSGQPIARGYLVKAIIFKGEIGYPKNIGFWSYTFIRK